MKMYQKKLGKWLRGLLLFYLFTFLPLRTQAQGVIDVHSHIITPEFVSALDKEGRLLDEGFPLPKWDAEAQLKWMDEAGIQTSVLTLAAPNPTSASIIRKTNEAAAKLKREHSDRFRFCAALPLPDVNAAIEEARYALDVLGADGIKLATNVGGQYLGAPELDTLFSFLNERKAVVILHPHRPEPVNRQMMQQTPLAMQEYISETTRAVSNMISRNVLARYNNIKVVVPHCGAYLPLMVPRMKSLTPVMQANKLVGDIDWEANLAALYYDLAGAHSPEVIRMLLTITTPDHLLYGSDYPYVAPQVLTQSLQRMQQYLTTEPDLAPYKEMILYKNARSLTPSPSPFGEGSDYFQGQQLSTPLSTRRGAGGEALCRIAEIEVYPEHLEAYLNAATEIQLKSLAEEPGVLCLFPNQMKEDSTQFRILEIYASQEAYQHHIQTAHFQKYKQGTLHMVKSLKLQDLTPLDRNTMNKIFKRHK